MDTNLKTLREVLEVPNSGLVKPLMSPKVKVVVFLLAALALCAEVEAGNSVATMTVSAIVRNACTATTTADSRDVKAVASISASGEVSVDCATNTPFNIAMNEGVISGATSSLGTATTAADTLAFNVFEDKALTKSWGTLAGPGALSGTYRALQEPLPVHGALAQEQVSATPNSDRLTMTVNY